MTDEAATLRRISKIKKLNNQQIDKKGSKKEVNNKSLGCDTTKEFTEGRKKLLALLPMTAISP